MHLACLCTLVSCWTSRLHSLSFGAHFDARYTAVLLLAAHVTSAPLMIDMVYHAVPCCAMLCHSCSALPVFGGSSSIWMSWELLTT